MRDIRKKPIGEKKCGGGVPEKDYLTRRGIN
jgi:hypothetical protein